MTKQEFLWAYEAELRAGGIYALDVEFLLARAKEYLYKGRDSWTADTPAAARAWQCIGGEGVPTPAKVKALPMLPLIFRFLRGYRMGVDALGRAINSLPLYWATNLVKLAMMWVFVLLFGGVVIWLEGTCLMYAFQFVVWLCQQVHLALFS